MKIRNLIQKEFKIANQPPPKDKADYKAKMSTIQDLQKNPKLRDPESQANIMKRKAELDTWAKKINVSIIKQEMGSDPASVAYDTVQSAIANDVDYVIIDTAGRLHNKVNLMVELEKITKVINKLLPESPQEVVLALDASTGQNALEQAKQFLKSTKVTHLALTKLDGTAKGGVVISIYAQLNNPIKYIGVGEKIDDIQLFDKIRFVESLFK